MLFLHFGHKIQYDPPSYLIHLYHNLYLVLGPFYLYHKQVSCILYIHCFVLYLSPLFLQNIYHFYMESPYFQILSLLFNHKIHLFFHMYSIYLLHYFHKNHIPPFQRVTLQLQNMYLYS